VQKSVDSFSKVSFAEVLRFQIVAILTDNSRV